MTCNSGPFAFYSASKETAVTVRVHTKASALICTGEILVDRGGIQQPPQRLAHNQIIGGHTIPVEPGDIISIEIRTTFTSDTEETARVQLSLAPAGEPAEDYCNEVRGHNGQSSTCTIGVFRR
jgi:hypothetical protein